MGALGLPGVRRARAIILENTRLVFPGWSESRRRGFVARLGRSFGRNGFDFVRLGRYSLDDVARLVRVEGLEHLDRAHARGRGVICLGAHMGCWELIPYRLRSLGYPVGVVYRPLREEALDRYVSQRRGRFGIATHSREQDVRKVLRSLRRGGLVGMLADQNTRVESIPVPFLGRSARTPAGPARLALRTGAAIVPITIRLEGEGTHLMHVGPEIRVVAPGAGAPPREIAARVEEATLRCNEAIGRAILEAPEQWVWFHERWRDA